jgi:hypothetical protein
MSLGARVFLLLVPLVTALDPAAAHAAESGDFAGLVDIGGGPQDLSGVPRHRRSHGRVGG